MPISFRLAISLLLCSSVGCADDGPGSIPDPIDAAVTAPDAEVPDAPAPVTGIAATINYGGTAEGALILAAFTSSPPSGPPTGFAQRATPSYPESLAIEGLVPGTYYVLALIDVAPASPTQPGPEDRQAWSGAVDVVPDQMTDVAITVTDPP